MKHVERLCRERRAWWHLGASLFSSSAPETRGKRPSTRPSSPDPTPAAAALFQRLLRSKGCDQGGQDAVPARCHPFNRPGAALGRYLPKPGNRCLGLNTPERTQSRPGSCKRFSEIRKLQDRVSHAKEFELYSQSSGKKLLKGLLKMD